MVISPNKYSRFISSPSKKNHKYFTRNRVIFEIQVVFYYINNMNSIIMAETESEVTAAVREAAVNAVAKRVNLTKHVCVVAVKKAQEGVKGVLGALK